MRIIPQDFEDMTIVVVARCPNCNEWAGTVIRSFSSPVEALTSEDWPNIKLEPVVCCDREVWPDTFLVIYAGAIMEEVPIGGSELPIEQKPTFEH